MWIDNHFMGQKNLGEAVFDPYIMTREIPAFGAPVGAPLAPIWETAAFGGGERTKIILGRRGRPGGGSAYTAFGGEKK